MYTELCVFLEYALVALYIQLTRVSTVNYLILLFYKNTTVITQNTDLCVLQSPLTNCVTLVVKQVELMKICFHYCVYELLPHISFVLLFTNQSLMHQNQSSKLILNMNYVIVHVCMRICINVILQF